METPEKTYVLENILKKKRKTAKELEDKARAKVLSKKAHLSQKIKKEKIILPDQFIKKYKANQTSYQRLKKRRGKINKMEAIPAGKTLILIRLRGNEKLSPRVSSILKSLKLREIHSAIFIKTTEKISEKIKLIEPYITYGVPSRKMVSELIFKKGFAGIEGKRIQINNNEIIEKELGKLGLLCIEDLVHEIVKSGEHFEQVNTFLWPFKLSFPKKEDILKNPKKPYDKGGDWGDRKEKINDLLSHMI